MKIKVFAVYDSAVGAYMQPFFMQSKGLALRSWLDAANDPKTQFHAHPADFTLFEIGEYDEIEGVLTTHPVKVNLGTALELKAKAQNSPRQTAPVRGDETSLPKNEGLDSMDGKLRSISNAEIVTQ